MQTSTGYERDLINYRVKIRDLFDWLVGVEFNAAGFCRCPLHQEKTASFKLYEKSNSFFCFGCGKGGDAIRLYAELKGIRYFQAMHRIDDEFNLGVFVKKSPMQMAREAAERAREKQERDDAAERLNHIEDVLTTYFKELRQMPLTPAVCFDLSFVERIYLTVC